MSTIKMIGAVAIMIACFAVVYPRFMHPLVLRALGLSEPQKKNVDDMYPPGFKGANPEKTKADGRDDVRRHMRPGPHPGMRAAAEMQKQQAQQGSGRGMMGVVLPMYAVGIVLYLVYTLFKVFNKSKNNSWSTPKRPQYGSYGGSEQPIDRMGFPMSYDGSGGDVRNFLSDRQQRKDLEDLLTRVDDKNVSIDEMRLLQKRLEETEAQMSRILQAMNAVQSNVEMMNVPPTDETQEMGNIDMSEDAGMADDKLKKESAKKKSSQGDGEKKRANKKDKSTKGAEDKEKEANDEKNVDDKGTSQKKEVDLDGIDKESDEENDNVRDDGQQDREYDPGSDDEEEEEEEDECEEEVIDDNSERDEETQSNVRQRKKHDNEQ